MSKPPVFFIHGNSDPKFVERFAPLKSQLLGRGYSEGHFYGISYGSGKADSTSLLNTAVTPELIKRHESAFRAMFHQHFGVPIEKAEPHMKFVVVAHSMGVHIGMNMLIGGLDRHVQKFVNVGGAPNGLELIPGTGTAKKMNPLARAWFDYTLIGKLQQGMLGAANPAMNKAAELYFTLNPFGRMQRAALDAFAPSVSRATGVAADSEPTRRIQQNPLNVGEFVSLRGSRSFVSQQANHYRHGRYETLQGADHLEAASHPRIAEIIASP